MSKWFLSILLMMFCLPCFAVENQPLEVSENLSNSQNTEMPKGLLADENYKIKGRVEYNENGVLFLDFEDKDLQSLKIRNPKKYSKKSVLSEKNLFAQIEGQHKYRTPQVDEYWITPFLSQIEHKDGNVSYGADFSTEMDTAQLEYRTKFFVKYENRYLGVMTAVGQDEYTSTGIQMSSIYLSPELKLGRNISIAGLLKANPEYNRCRSDVMLRYKPKIKNSTDKLYFEAGLSQMSYFDLGEQNYQFYVSTKYRF